MPIRCILVPIHPGLSPEHCLDAALRIAARANAHLTALYVRPEPAAIAAGLPDLVAGAGLDLATIERFGKEAAHRARAAFEAWCAARKVPMHASRRLDETFAVWREDIGDLAACVATLGRVNDLIVVDGRLRGGALSAGALDAAIFSSGRPALVVGEAIPTDFLRHAVIAWNGSLEGSRVVAHSLGLLHEAEKVWVFTAATTKPQDRSLGDLQSYLRYHGIVAQPAMAPSAPFDTVGEALLATCDEARASLLVMGAYTRSRIHESYLGGVTRHVLHNAKIPVLLSY